MPYSQKDIHYISCARYTIASAEITIHVWPLNKTKMGSASFNMLKCQTFKQ